MSFSSEVKNELAHLPASKPCCARAEAAGFFRACGSVRRVGGARGGLLGFVLQTSNPAVARHEKMLFEHLQGVAGGLGITLNVSVSEDRGGAVPKRYEMKAAASDRGTAFLETIGIIGRVDGKLALSARTPADMLASKCCRKAFLRGLFLGAGSVSDPEHGYHFEIALDDPMLAADARRIMNSFTDIHARVSRRKGRPVVYLKASEQIKDMLGILGADRHLLAYEEVRMIREMKETANRISNCDNANVDRALRAGESQVDFITALLRGGGGFPETLP
ncbi:MAG: DNA-binding protein WhiA, partial [Clostridiales Family XIII bacterium]|nr:DNA-binding protein WhiA [Clostridiales Family XIII bacterium]